MDPWDITFGRTGRRSAGTCMAYRQCLRDEEVVSVRIVNESGGDECGEAPPRREKSGAPRLLYWGSTGAIWVVRVPRDGRNEYSRERMWRATCWGRVKVD